MAAWSVAAAPARSRDVLRRWFDVLPTATCATATGQLEVSVEYLVCGKDGDESEPATPAAPTAYNRKTREKCAQRDQHWEFVRGPCDVVFDAGKQAEKDATYFLEKRDAQDNRIGWKLTRAGQRHVAAALAATMVSA